MSFGAEEIFGPTLTPPSPSYSRIRLQDDIIRANTERPVFSPSSAIGREEMLQFLASRGITVRGEAGDEGEIVQNCATQ